jgi:hypothetical protein
MLITSRAFYAGAMCIILSGLFWLTRIGEERSHGINQSLVDNVKHRLKVEHVVIKIRKKPMKASAFGGFAIPLAPFFVSVGYSSLVDKTEAIIHELVHDNLFIYSFQTAVFYFVLAFVNAAIIIPLWWTVLLAFCMVVTFMILQEMVTFYKTNRIAAEFGIRTRVFSGFILAKYVLFYTTWIVFLGIDIWLMSYVNYALALFVLIVGLWGINKVFFYLSLWMKKTFKDSKNNKVYKLEWFMR